MFDNFSLKALFGQEEHADSKEQLAEAPLVDMADFQAAAIAADIGANENQVAMGEVFDNDMPADEIYASSQAAVNFWDVVQGKSEDIQIEQAFSDDLPPAAPSVYEQAVSELDNAHHNEASAHHFNIDTLNDILNPYVEMYNI